MDGQQLDGHSLATAWGRRTIHATRLLRPEGDHSTIRRICFRFIEEPSRHFTLEICNKLLAEDLERVLVVLSAWLMRGPAPGTTFRVDEALFRPQPA